MNRLIGAPGFVNPCCLRQARVIHLCKMGLPSAEKLLRPTRRRSKRLRSPPPPPASSASSSPHNSDSDFEPTSPAISLPDSAHDLDFSPSPPRKQRRSLQKSVSVPPAAAIQSSPMSSRRTFTASEVDILRTSLLDWYADNYRTLPWRSPPVYRKGGLAPLPRYSPPTPSSAGSPYAVWVSEVMSQQTRLSVVEGYFIRWMSAFPDVQALANAPLEQVNELWAGLGYYRRARFLREGAMQVVQEHGGSLPGDVARLLKIKGVGRYTAGAISSIAFGKNAPVVDGNVERVLARLLPGLTAPQSETRQAASLPAAYWELAETLVKDVECPGDFNQALMEFGATVCKPKAVLCAHCPVQTICGAYQESVELGVEGPAEYVTKYPIKDPKKATKVRNETVAVLVACTEVERELKFLVLQRPGNGLLAGLWEAPSRVLESKTAAKRADVMESLHLLIQQTLDISGQDAKSSRGASTLNVDVGSVTHIFSHIRQTLDVELTILRLKDAEATATSGYTSEGIAFRWIPRSELESAAVSTQMKKVFAAAFRKLPRAKHVRRK